MIFISVNNPTKTKGLGAGKASDLNGLKQVLGMSLNTQKDILLLLRKVLYQLKLLK